MRKIKLLIKRIIMSSFIFIKGIICIFRTVRRGKRAKPETDFEPSGVLILGNGPSLGELDIAALAEKYTLGCVNFFATRNELFFTVKPRYYFLMDPLFFYPNERRAELFAEFEKIDWDMTLVIPQEEKLVFENKHILLDYVNVSELCSDYFKSFQHLLYKKNYAICGDNNVMVEALYYMLVKKPPVIYLAGVDMSFFKQLSVDENNHVYIMQSHFYENIKVDMTGIGTVAPGRFCDRFGIYHAVFVQMRELSLFSEYQKVKVINLSLESFIDSFEKQKWTELL